MKTCFHLLHFLCFCVIVIYVFLSLSAGRDTGARPLPKGCGIRDVEAAMQPFYSTGDGAERSGMGFCVMQTFMDEVDVRSTPGSGTSVYMRKRIRPETAH